MSFSASKQEVPGETKQYERGWECSFCDNLRTVRQLVGPCRNRSILKQLLTDFFRFYDSFDYELVICPLLGRPVDQCVFDDPANLPPEMKMYAENQMADPPTFQIFSPIRMQDPFELSLNLTKNVRPASYETFKNACKASLEICETAEEELILTKLFSLEPSTLAPTKEPPLCWHIEFYHPSRSDCPDSELLAWYDRTVEAVLFFMKEVAKVDVEMKDPENCHKIRKTGSQQDVHTTQGADSVYVCTGNVNVWANRKKISKSLISRGVSLNPLEKAICVSNLVLSYKSVQQMIFNILFSSFETFCQNRQGVVVTLDMPGKCSWTKPMTSFISANLKSVVGLTTEYLQSKRMLKDLVDSVRQKTKVFVPAPETKKLQEVKHEIEEGRNERILLNQNLLLAGIGS